jgi:hypothetical protein
VHGSRLSGHSNLEIAKLDFDFGEVGVVEDARKITHQLLVNAGFLCRHGEAFFCHFSVRPQMRAASA